MKIAINCWILRNRNIDGIGNFCIETVRQMAQQHPEDELLLLCDKNFSGDYFPFKNIRLYKILPPYRHPLLYIFYMETVVKNFLKIHRPDVFVGIEGLLCLGSSTPQVPVIHDLNFEHYPQDLPWRNRVYYRYFMPAFARKAAQVATVSQFTKKDIIEKYRLSPAKIDVVYCGIKENFVPLSVAQKEEVRKKYTSGQPYFFFVGSMHPRKNLLRLIEGYDIFRKNHPGLQHRLVLSGNILWDHTMFDKVLSKTAHKEDIIFTGRVEDAELTYLLGAAEALTFFPTFEGFGLPIVEAFQAGVPVACSNVTSMPEIAGEAALLADPLDKYAIADALGTMAGNEPLRQTLIAKGFERKALFSWEKTSALLYESLLKALR